MNSNSKSSKGSASAHLSRPRFVKVKKHTPAAAPSHISATPNPGFNPFSPSQMTTGTSTLNSTFIFGASSGGIAYDPLVDKIRNMNISDGNNDVNKGLFVFETGGKKSSHSDDRTRDNVVQTELPDQISKLNIKDSGVRNMSGDSKNVLPDMFQKLNIKDSMVSDQGNVGLGNKSGSAYNESYQTKYAFQAGDIKLASASPGIRTPYVEFKTPNIKEFLVSGLQEPRGDSTKDAKLKKKKRNLRKPTACHLMRDEEYVFREVSSRENCESSEAYSPMDVSPYQETVAESNYSRETSVTSEEVLYPGNSYASSESHPIVSSNAIDEDLVAATNRLNINRSDTNYAGFGYEDGTDCCDKGFVAEGPSEESISGAETESFKSATEQLEYSSDTFVTAGDTEVSSCSSLERQDIDGNMQFHSSSSIEDTGSSSFTFAASSSNQASFSADTRHYKKKHKLKVGNDTYSSFLNDNVPFESSPLPYIPISGTSYSLSPKQGKGDEFKSFGKTEDRSELIKEQEVKQVSFSSATSIAAKEACEKWRLRFKFCLRSLYFYARF